MAVSSAFLGAKLETLLVSNTASSSSAGHVGSPASARARRAALIRKNWGMIRCEAAPDALAQAESPNAASFSASASSLSALEQLKTSAADSMNAFLSYLFPQFVIFCSNWNVMN